MNLKGAFKIRRALAPAKRTYTRILSRQTDPNLHSATAWFTLSRHKLRFDPELSEASMRLMDLVADAQAERLCISDGWRRTELRGVAAYSEAIKRCPLRYVLGDEVGRICESLLMTDAGMLDPANALLRLPAEHFWLEWTREGSLPEAEERGRQRVGCLVESTADGRSGSIHSFWIDEAGKAQAAQVYLEFDLDNLPVVSGSEGCQARHDRPEFQVLLNHVTVRVEPDWAPYAASLTQAQRNLFFSACTARIWFDLPFAFAFAALLGFGSYVTTTHSRLDKLNRCRLMRGRPALLDHVETRLCLGDQSREQQHNVGNEVRAAPRLHVVRGHMVRRQDTTYWRMTHLRGDPAAIQAIKTGLVTVLRRSLES